MADRYCVFGQIFIEDGTASISTTGRKVADTNFTCAGAGNFKVHMSNGCTGTVAGTNVQNSPVTLAAGENTITTTDAVADGVIDITIGTDANWNTVNSWSATAGGKCGASVPTSEDNAYFDASSFTAGSQVLTVDATAYCYDMDWTGATNTPTLHLVASLNHYGNVVFIDAMNITNSANNAIASNTNANSITFPSGSIAARIAIISGSLTFLSGLTTTLNIQHSGTLDTNGQTVTCLFYYSDFTSTRVLTLGNSTINITSSGTSGWLVNATNYTVTANTATINISGTGACALGNANYNGASFNLNGTAHTVSGSPTGINVFTRNGTATKTDTLTLTSGTTLGCTTFAMIGNSATNRLLVQSSTLGTAATITATNWTGTQNVDLMDLTATNAVDLSAITGNSGDCGGNTNITFTTAAAQISAANGDWDTLATWQDGVGTDRVPLPQDDVSCSHNVAVDMPRIGKSITFTGTPTISLSNTIENYGSFTLVGGMTYTHNNKSLWMRGRGEYTVTCASKSLYNLVIGCPNGKVTYLDNNNSSIVPNSGTLDLNDFNTSTWTLNRYTTTPFTLYMGNGTMTVTSTDAGTKVNMSYANTTVYKENSTIILTNSTANAQTFAGGTATYNNVRVEGAGNYALTITGNNTFSGDFYIDASEAAKTIITTDTTQTFAKPVRRDAGTNVITATGGTWARNSSGKVSLDYLSLTDVVGTPTQMWYAGKNSTDNGGNTNWIFNTPTNPTGSLIDSLLLEGLL